MQKFYNRPEIYEVVKGRGIKKGTEVIPYNTTQDGSAIMIYLGDLEILPSEELHYLKSFNILCPKNPMTKDRFKRDFKGKFTSPKDLGYQIETKIRELNDLFIEKYNYSLFRLENKEVQDALEHIHIPTTDDKIEFENVILKMSRVFVESIQSSELKNDLENLDGLENNKSIKVLEFFIKKKLPDWADLNLIKYLFFLWDLRNGGVAHIKGSNYQKLLEKLDLENKNNIYIVKWLLEGIIEFIQGFINNL